MGDFNINRINYDSHNPTSQLLDGICYSFFPYKNIAVRHTPRFKALIDNIFHNNVNENGNIWYFKYLYLRSFSPIPNHSEFY